MHVYQATHISYRHQAIDRTSQFQGLSKAGSLRTPLAFLVGERADIAGVDLEQVFRGSLAGCRDGTHSEFA